MPPATLPLLPVAIDETPFAVRGGNRVTTRAAFIADVARLARALPERAYAVNLCEDRYLFTTAFAAVAVRGQASLLPASRSDADIADAISAFPGRHRLDDTLVAGAIAADAPSRAETCGPTLPPAISVDQVVAVPFTSGSTGRSQPHPKRWGELVAGARLADRRFGFAATAVSAIVATVAPQHMYGLETSVLVPMIIGIAVHRHRPFFPENIRRALDEAGPRPVLVTTPVHLAACVNAGLAWPPVTLVISATAPLSRELAARAEQMLAAPVMEIYGFTEAGSIASRRTVADNVWQPYDGMAIANGLLRADHLEAPVPLNDVVESRADGRFALLGRAADLINVAGKRTSLAHLNRVLNEIDGVEDGAFVVPDVAGESARLAAAVVAPGLTRHDVLAALVGRIDPLFMPRPLVLVDRLPRDENGKLPRLALRALLDAGESGPGR